MSPNLGHLWTKEEETGGRKSELGTPSDRRGKNQSELAISLEGEETSGNMSKECRL
ncbi:hypothetical protein [Cytobacillus firmus]|uniref:hypothetical protein n=1 Tax=Cytobacillus firmus TaxID=1399 RepID=UPI00216250AA|nr:hypothetical protein [Cytobacillus firmus]MCS0671385.1 hypothetical protein [Cytobacillus firmus]